MVGRNDALYVLAGWILESWLGRSDVWPYVAVYLAFGALFALWLRRKSRRLERCSVIFEAVRAWKQAQRSRE